MTKPRSNRSEDGDEAPEAAKAPRAKRRRPRLPLWIAAGVAILVALYAALGFWVAPGAIRKEALAQIDQRYHRAARLDAVRLNPFTLRLELDGFSLPDVDRRPMIAFRRLVVVVSPSTLWSGGYVFRGIELDAPAVRLVRRKDGRLNLADLLPPPSKTPTSPPPKIVVERLAVRGGRVDVVDLDRPTPFAKTFEAVRFTLDDFSTRRDGAGYALSATTPTGERVSWRGQAGVAPLASSGRFAFSRIAAAPLAAFAGLPFTLD
ncbi:MAG: DUF748 domain-containing protein, partial [Caulobacteraceae bacterium]